MTQTLQNISFAAIARNFWNNYEFEQPIGPSPQQYIAILKQFRQQIDNFQLPLVLQIELKLAILEFGKRKIIKDSKKLELRVEPERPSSLDQALREFLPRYFYDRPDVRIRAPRLQLYFPEDRDRRLVVDFFFALILVNPRDDPTVLRECWTSPAFVPLQSMFLDSFLYIWYKIKDGVRRQSMDNHAGRRQSRAFSIVSTQMHLVSVSNESIPWFVFELLDGDQRDKFLALRDTMLLTSGSPLTTFFATLLCHWPWQYEAFDRCFAKKKELSDNDKAVLENVLLRKQLEEQEALCAELLPRNSSFYRKVKKFFDAKNLPT